MASVQLTNGKSFTSDGNQSLLDDAMKAGLKLSYSCRTGRCSSCKCRVLRGQTVEIGAETGLQANEKAEGWILSCVRSASSDLLIEADDLGDLELSDPKTLPCRISSINYLAPDVVQVFLRFPPTTQFAFLPGQYVDIIGAGAVRRSYSIANSDFSMKQVELHIRQVDDGAMSGYWFNEAAENDLLRLNGPLGTFFLRDAKELDVVFLATGTGIAPVKAIVESLPYAAVDQRPRSVTILWGGRQRTDHYLDIPTLPGEHRYIPVLSRPDPEWNGATGYVQDTLLDLEPDLVNAAVYACGSDAMINSAKTALLKAGLSSRRFYSDAFVCSKSNSQL